jgi:hypothetical protein
LQDDQAQFNQTFFNMQRIPVGNGNSNKARA